MSTFRHVPLKRMPSQFQTPSKKSLALTRTLISAGVVGYLLAPQMLEAHAKFTDPLPRVDRADLKERHAPCGGPRSQTPHVVQVGDALDLNWIETIDHPGWYRLRFSLAGDDHWEVIADQLEDRSGRNNRYRYAWRVPDRPCTDCTVQLIQVMTDRQPPTNYYSCIDIRIQAGSVEPVDMGDPAPDMGVEMGVEFPDVTPNPKIDARDPAPRDAGLDEDLGISSDAGQIVSEEMNAPMDHGSLTPSPSELPKNDSSSRAGCSTLTSARPVALDVSEALAKTTSRAERESRSVNEDQSTSPMQMIMHSLFLMWCFRAWLATAAKARKADLYPDRDDRVS